jgi:hypothetical protein
MAAYSVLQNIHTGTGVHFFLQWTLSYRFLSLKPLSGVHFLLQWTLSYRLLSLKPLSGVHFLLQWMLSYRFLSLKPLSSVRTGLPPPVMLTYFKIWDL